MNKVYCQDCRKHIASVPKGWSVPNMTILYCLKCADKPKNK